VTRMGLLRVLLVEDDAEDSALARRALGRLASYHCDVQWAPTYEAGAEALRAGALDLIVLDQQLGGRTGLELLEEVFGERPPLPVVLLTGVADHDTDVRASAMGVAALLEKAALTPAALERNVRYALERVRVERELRGARAFLRASFDALREHVAIVDVAGTIVEVNAAWDRFAAENGCGPGNDWRGTNYLAVCEAAAGEHAEEAAAAARGIREVLAGTRSSFHLEYPCHAPGAERWFLLRAVRFESTGRALAYVAHHDVTQRHLAERALRSSEARYRRLVETSHEGICTVDGAGAITYANRRLAEILGYELIELAGRPIFDFMEPEAAFAARPRVGRRPRGVNGGDELAFRRRAGETVWVRKSASPLFDAKGAFTGATYVLGDITERRAAERRLAASERYFRALTENSSELVSILDGDGTLRYANPAYQRTFGLNAEQVVGTRVDAFIHPDDLARVQDVFARLTRAPGGVTTTEYRVRADEGPWQHRRAVVQNLLHDDAVGGIVVNSSDVTEQRRAEETLRENERRYRLLFERNPLSMYVADAESRRFLAVNEAMVAHYGYSREELLAMRLDDIQPAEDRVAFVQAFPTTGGYAAAGRHRHLKRDGTVIDVDLVADQVTFGDREARLVLANDVTDRVRSEAALREAHGAMETLVNAAPIAIVTLDVDGNVRSWNPAAARIFGWTAVEVIGRPNPIVPDEQRAEYLRRLAEHLRTGSGFSEMETWRVRKDGTLVDVALSSAPMRHPDGTTSGSVVLLSDITARKRAEVALDEARRQTELLLASAGEGIYAMDAAGLITFVNPAAARLFGTAPDRLVGIEAHTRVHHSRADGSPYDVDECPICASVRDGTAHRVDTEVFWREDGSSFPVEYVSTPLRQGDRLVGAVVAFRDITARRELEEQLRQAQKMEAVGQLAGGVAHDFNNLLTVIMSYSMLLLGELPAEDPLRPDLREIQAASERAAGLTRQLLAFSRQQVLSPRVIDLRCVVDEMGNMLRRLVGEDVELSTELAGEPMHVLADPGQVEQVVMNLVVNARDAMPTGGQLAIDVDAVVVGPEDAGRQPYVAPGEYACVRVSDTGVGMDAETQARIFEPFFTTKEAGKGTGLGLATVYGIVKQSGGYIWVESVPGMGTTFRVYLPRVAGLSEDDGATAAVTVAPERRGITVLLAEDETALRTIVQRVLAKRGYTVLAAAGGPEALALAERHDGEIDLLVTDVVMPKMSGQELAEHLARSRGEIPVLFMTGYSLEAVANHGVLRPGARLIHKPFTPQDLALAADELLGATGSGGGAA
jgi:two-component system cell cycle sensor histidine kinase/response regulator CckA